jgi:integrase
VRSSNFARFFRLLRWSTKIRRMAVVKRAIIRAALADRLAPQEATSLAGKFGGHSLRASPATSAAMNDAPGDAIQRQLRHTRFDMTTRYIRAGQLFKQNAAGMAGL